MSQEVYNVTDQAQINVVSGLSPVTTESYSEYMAGNKSALEYETAPDAASVASWLNSTQDTVVYVVVGPHPRPHH